MDENKIKHVYGEVIFDRGKGYFINLSFIERNRCK